MSLGQKIANRILLAYLAPLAIMLAVGLVFAYFAHYDMGRLALFVLAILFTVTLIGRLGSRRDTVRLSQIRRSAERIERGDYAARLPETADGDEYADLARAFNHMADVLAARESALREQNDALASVNQRTESLLDATNDGIALLDRSGVFVLVNRRFAEILGTHPDALLQQTLPNAHPHLMERLAEPDRLVSRMAALTADDLRDPIGVAEEIIELHTPEHRFMQVYTAPVQGALHDEGGASVIGRIIALRDVTRERELDKMKTDFISVVSHELRTPLTSIKGYTDLLLSGAAGETGELQREFLGIIQGSTTRLSNLINDILDISRIESGRIDIKHEPIDYRKIVADSLRLMHAHADEKQIVMDASLPEIMPLVSGDADKVTQVVTNLISNALKYTPPGGWIKVLLEVTGDANVTTCVADSGIGIGAEDQKKLFQKFFRADNTSTREAGGTGLGLVIAKSIIELLGGAIWVESEVGKGSKFFFTLPLSVGEDVPPPEAYALPERGIGLVMVADDDAYVRGLVQHHLHRRGYGTLSVGTAAEALQKARQHKPDAITLDILMPEMEGFHLLRSLKQDPATAAIPVVIISMVGDPARGGLSLGAVSFVRTPPDEDALAETIADAVATVRDGEAPATVLYVGHPPAPDHTASLLAPQGVALRVADSASDAVVLTITESPDIILIDMALPDETLFELISALKVEEEAARIPIILMSEDIADGGIHFHMGSDSADNNASLDYICEQIKRVLVAEAPVG